MQGSHIVVSISMLLLSERTVAFAPTGRKVLCGHYASSRSRQYTATRRPMPSTTMDEPLCEESPDLSTWGADRLIARVKFLEQQLKEQTTKCANSEASLQPVLIL